MKLLLFFLLSIYACLEVEVGKNLEDYWIFDVGKFYELHSTHQISFMKIYKKNNELKLILFSYPEAFEKYENISYICSQNLCKVYSDGKKELMEIILSNENEIILSEPPLVLRSTIYRSDNSDTKIPFFPKNSKLTRNAELSRVLEISLHEIFKN